MSAKQYIEACKAAHAVSNLTNQKFLSLIEAGIKTGLRRKSKQVRP